MPPDPPTSPPRRPTAKLSVLAFIAAALIAVGYYFFSSGQRERGKEEATKAAFPAGFADLSDCTVTTSFDGLKELELDENHNALVRQQSTKPGEYETTRGTWAFDPDTKLYTITFNGNAGAYALVKPHGFCLLVQGNADLANLWQSWFTMTSDDAPDYGPSYEEAHEPH